MKRNNKKRKGVRIGDPYSCLLFQPQLTASVDRGKKSYCYLLFALYKSDYFIFYFLHNHEKVVRTGNKNHVTHMSKGKAPRLPADAGFVTVTASLSLPSNS